MRILTVMDTTFPSAVIDELRWILRDSRLCVLTGAGISTDSGIPDYRGPEGSLKKRTPLRYHEFIRSDENRRHYWARSYHGWPYMRTRQPNAAHRAIASLERSGRLNGVITQNVDGLHSKAGSNGVIELHGALRRVRCLDCGAVSDRDELQERMREENSDRLPAIAEYAPDGDAELPRSVTRTFVVPKCRRCGGVLKPDVVFFGENVPAVRVNDAFRCVDAADALVVAGSSLTVYSGFRFADHAVKRGKPVAIINRGTTRADSIASIKVEGNAGEVLTALAERAS